MIVRITCSALLCLLGGIWIGVCEAAQSLAVLYDEPCTEEERIQAEYIAASGMADSIEIHINGNYDLPETIVIRFACATPEEGLGPYYDPSIREVVMPYGFRSYVYSTFHSDDYMDSEEDLHIVTDDVVQHVMYHELGHAFVDVLALPITGREEDAVDELSTLMLLAAYENGDEIALSTADFFEIESRQYDEITDDAIFGEHSLDEQRFFNMLCLIYGADPEGRVEMMEDLGISEDRAMLCLEDYVKRSLAWATLLEPYFAEE
jgi:hypothetical protein